MLASARAGASAKCLWQANRAPGSSNQLEILRHPNADARYRFISRVAPGFWHLRLFQIGLARIVERDYLEDNEEDRIAVRRSGSTSSRYGTRPGGRFSGRRGSVCA